MSAQSERKLGLGVGPDVWFELGGDRCERDSDVVSCSSALHAFMIGVRATFDGNVLHWLRVGANFGFAYDLTGSELAGSDGYSETQRHVVLPLGIHAHAHLEPHPKLSLWAGPELAYALHLDQRHQTGLGFEHTELAARSGVLAGVAFGLDRSLGKSAWLGFFLSESVSFAQQRTLPTPTVGSQLSSMTRVGLVFRFFF